MISVVCTAFIVAEDRESKWILFVGGLSIVNLILNLILIVDLILI